MTDSDNHSGNQRDQWSPEDWRLLMITFVGGLASIVVGAAMLGLAIALARIWHPANDFGTWFGLGICPVLTAIGVPLFFRDRKKSVGNTLGLYFCGLVTLIVILIWIGVGAGIK
jgi:hypothetical protein